jgi:hypothetical protein
MEHAIFDEEMASARVPSVGGIGVSMMGPTLIAFGSAQQQQQHVPRILSGEVAWAQGFSEPGAGSDLAALSTTATRDGDAYVLRGQKIWTSAAQYADWLCVLARTDPEAPRHRGLSFFLVDVRSPGVTIRPIADMSWSHPFNEVFLDDVRVPAANLVGEEHRGWYVAMGMLDFERSGVAGAIKDRLLVEDLLPLARGAKDGCTTPLRSDATAALRSEIAARYIEGGVAYQLAMRTVSMQAAGELPNYEAAVNQMVRAEFYQRIAQTSANALGLYANLWNWEQEPAVAAITREYVRASPQTVLSGTSEIQRNVIATRGLGLPRS